MAVHALTGRRFDHPVCSRSAVDYLKTPGKLAQEKAGFRYAERQDKRRVDPPAQY